MTKDSSPAIDPRYDPVYQRGFTGAASPARIRAVEVPKERPAAPQRPEPPRASRTPQDASVDSFVVPPAESSIPD